VGKLKAYLTRLFRRHGAQTVLVASGKSVMGAELETSIGQLLGDALSEECKSVDKNKAGSAIKQFFREQTSERAQYIAQLLDATFSFYALFTDEATQNYLKSAIPKITVLLDTNFLFGVLNLHDNPQNQVSLELVALVQQQKLPFNLYYHEESLQEMLETIAQTEKRLSKHSWLPALSRAVLQTRAQDLTGLEFKFHEANAEYQVDPSAYFLKFRHIDKVLDSKGFKLYRRSGKREIDARGEEKLDEKTLELISKYQRFLDERFPCYRQKSFNTVKHDIIVWRATKALRKSEAAGLDVGALMLSADQHLFAFDRGVLSDQNGMGVVVLPSQLLQLLRPFVPRTANFDKNFAEVFALPEFRAGGSDFSQVTHRVLGFLATIKDLCEETAAAILADELLLRRLKGVETDMEIQAAIESEILKKNAELSSQHKAVAAKLESAQAEAVEKQKLLEAAQHGAASHEQKATELASEMERKRLEKEKSDNAAVAAEALLRRTHAELAAVNEEKLKLTGTLQQTSQKVSDLQTRLSAIEARNRKISRVISGIVFSLAGWAAVLWLPLISNWQWLQTHQRKVSIYLAAFVLIAGFAWGLFAWKHRAWAWSALVLAVVIRLIGVL
jgi:hypothetical protein